MAIITNLDVMLAKRKMKLNELSELVGITLSNLSILKQGKAKAIKLSTLDSICKALNCQPGDILEYQESENKKVEKMESKMITILGPTATGKTQLAAAVAAKINGEIISADSRQVYRGMDLGTGKDYEDYVVDGLAVPYHLIDIAEPGYIYNVYEFQHDFNKVYKDILSRGKTPILCGGTGMYLESVLLGYDLIEVPEDEELRASFESKSDQELIALLKKKKELHNITDISERKRMIRALEIQFYYENHPEKVKKHFPGISSEVFGISLERNTVRERITRRLRERLNSGMIEEVKQLLDSGLAPEQLIYYGLEYKFITLHLTGELNYETMFTKLNTAIHQFAKRQMTWFRRMEKRGVKIQWLDGMLPLDERTGIITQAVKNK